MGIMTQDTSWERGTTMVQSVIWCLLFPCSAPRTVNVSGASDCLMLQPRGAKERGGTISSKEQVISLRKNDRKLKQIK